MTAKLTFDLKKDQHAFDCAVNGVKYYDIIHGILEYMGSIEKSEDLTAEQYLMLGRIRNWMHGELQREGLASGF